MIMKERNGLGSLGHDSKCRSCNAVDRGRVGRNNARCGVHQESFGEPMSVDRRGGVALDPSAFADDFARRGLPPADLWPVIDQAALARLRYPKRMNAAVELLDRAVAQGQGSSACLRSVHATWSYAELLENANRIAGVLVNDMGLVSGNRVLLRSANNPMLAACWFAVLKAGGIAVTTMPLLRSRELAQICNKTEVQLALCDARLASELEATLPLQQSLKQVRYFNCDNPDGLERLMRGQVDIFDNIIPSHDDVALIAFTSGTTGPAKATMHFHRDVLAICDCYPAEVLRSDPNDIFAGSAPLGFTYGLGSLLLFPMRRGCSSILLEQSSPEIMLQAVQDFGVTTLLIGPTMYRGIAPHTDRFDLSTLHTCCSAGEHLPVAVYEEWLRRTGIRILDFMGSTEMLHAFIGVPRDDIRPGATGIALPGYQVRVVDESMNSVPPGIVGRLAVRGPIGCKYLNDPDRQRAYVVDGWNLTGDAFHADAGGFFWYHSRTDDMIVSSGYNISGHEIEEVLLEHWAIEECAVVGVPDSTRGQIVKAFVVLRDIPQDGEDLSRAIQDFVKNSIAPYKYPRAVEFVNELPKTQTGKINRAALRARS
jgi:2-aminobenzoate-CoA ligase